mmetsp:Transcript_15669/g.35950  ORF Transcript_15669/g.35950 Transcript_15669/m.35950 type:complete len:342 (+) Transcript_15669:3-1028(+)
MVGFDHVYVYDNSATQPGADTLQAICKEFPFVTYHRWPCQICNNHRPSHKNPGERSSQYAAEASCRERYGPSTEWMAFLDTDEYLVPMGENDSWKPFLEKQKNVHILKMRSSRAKPRRELMDENPDQSTCKNPVKVREPEGRPNKCLAPRATETYLRVYNCEYIRPPRPDRFERAMKQIYRPSHVWSHFVHYATVTANIAKYYKDFGPTESYHRRVHTAQTIFTSTKDGPDRFLNELEEGMLVHTRSVLPHETKFLKQSCALRSKFTCSVGIACPNTTEFVDKLHKDNVFVDEKGKYCNCWKNNKVELIYVPKLEKMLSEHKGRIEKANRSHRSLPSSSAR